MTQNTLPKGLRLSYKGIRPDIDESVFIAPTATIIGDVVIAENSSVWFGAVLRGDEVPIRVGRQSNIQDNVVIHGDTGGEVIIGDDVTIGHSAVIHGCTIGNGALIGMGAVVLDGVVIESGALIAAGAMVSPGKHIPANTLWAGCPARQIRDIDNDTKGTLSKSAEHYRIQALNYRSGKVQAMTTPLRHQQEDTLHDY